MNRPSESGFKSTEELVKFLEYRIEDCQKKIFALQLGNEKDRRSPNIPIKNKQRLIERREEAIEAINSQIADFQAIKDFVIDSYKKFCNQ